MMTEKDVGMRNVDGKQVRFTKKRREAIAAEWNANEAAKPGIAAEAERERKIQTRIRDTAISELIAEGEIS